MKPTVDQLTIADAVLEGILSASKEYDPWLDDSFDIMLSNYTGYINADEVHDRVKKEIATGILEGKTFGIVSYNPMNIEWELRRGN